ncbi:MAG: M14 family metallopeptidase [Candidatus Aminicenantes bacterium]
MKIMLRFKTFLVLLAVCAVFVSAQTNLLTVAEKSDFTATSRYADVMEFIQSLQERSHFIRVETLCTSPEGRPVPLLVMGNPLPVSPRDLLGDDRMVVYIQANIHAGEVEGKEASLMLARDILNQNPPPYLDNLVLLISPIFNADGNEKISPDNRRNQTGPEKGVGVRHNGQNLDLNRDSMKLESPELKGLIQNVLMRWNPALLVDCHTTNGSYHEEPVTYSWPLNPNGSRTILEYMRDRMMPEMTRQLKEKYQTLAVPYGNFMDYRDMEKGWRTFGHSPRYVTNYIGLRNRMSILIENYAYAEYKTRIMGNYHYLLTILDYCGQNKQEMTSLVREADRKTVSQGTTPETETGFGVEFDVQPLDNPVTILSWEMEITPRENQWPRVEKTDRKKTYTLPYYADFIATREVSFPFAYGIPIPAPEVIEKLRQHGITVESLQKEVEVEVEGFKVTALKPAERLYQGHYLNSVEGEYFKESKTLQPGTWIIRTGQSLGRLAAYLLEPESDDGLLVWNFFDRHLASQWRREPEICPVYKILKPLPLPAQEEK